MRLIAQLLVAFVAILHAWFLVMEMFLWTTPYGRRAFGTTQEQAEQSKVLAMNQGLYNGFLSAGLVWGLALGAAGRGVVIFFLLCVIAAGVFGAVTASRKILYVQALPAVLALAAWLLAAMPTRTYLN
jgi:putative membrane protein